MKRSSGITLVALVITIIIIIILATITINFVFGDDGLIGRAKQAKFYEIISALEEDAQLKSADRFFENKTMPELIPNYGEVTQEQKDNIVKNIPTLNESVYRATGETVYDRDLYWLNIDGVLNNTKKEYIIDMKTLQVYDHVGEVFLGSRWHTLNIGIDIGDNGEHDNPGEGGEEVPDGYMRIHLTYPEDSTDRQWRIGRPGETRDDGDLVWQDYTGDPILVKIDDIKNIWIRYNLKGVEVVEAPKGTLAVDIRVSPTAPYQEKVEVSVYFEEGSTNQKIKVGNGGWRMYTGPFEVTENCTIQAMAEKEMTVTDNDGNSLGTTTVKGKDSYKVTNIGEKEENVSLPAPTIQDVGNQGGTEKTTARVTYPSDQGNITRVYKLNSGVEQSYTGDVKIEEWGTEIIAYYYTEAGEKSPEARKTFEDPTKLEVNIFVQPNPSLDASIKSTTVEIEYSEEAEQKTYKIDNGAEQTYTGPLTVTEDCTITAYARKTGVNEARDTATIRFKEPPEEEVEKLEAPKFKQTDSEDKLTATVEITYDAKATIKQYKINEQSLQNYTGPITNLKEGDVIYAYCEDSEGNSADGTHTVNIQKNPLAAPKFEQTDSDDKMTATVAITYDENATVRQYRVNSGILQNYTGPITNLKDGDVIYAYCQDNQGQTKDASYTVKIELEQLKKPTFRQEDNEDKTAATVTITYDEKAVTKQYSINNGGLQDYTAPIENLHNGDEIYAVATDQHGQKAEATYTVQIEKIPMSKPTFKQTNNEDETIATVEITYDEKAVTKQYSVNDGQLQDYTAPVTNLKNGDKVYAVATDRDGDKAEATYTVKLSDLKAPVISPSYIEDDSKARITIKYDDKATTKQYKINDGPLQDYTEPFEVTENGTEIYAVNTNSAGESKDAKYTVDGIITKLDVKITVSPDTTETIEKVTVSIEYDSRATEKTYTMNGQKNNYTGPFEVTKNCTIIAEAKAENAYGKDTKQISNLPTGIAAPVITATKTKETGGEVANITITYDKNSISNTYSINSEAMQNYTSGFKVEENGTVITAYSVDKFGNSETAQYVVNDLEKYLLIDKDKYYWIKLPYPEGATNKEYKYKSDGVWKDYKEDGFILVKSEYEDELIQGGKIIKLEVEEGRYVDFDGHWYILDSDPQQLQEDIYMKWDDPGTTSNPKVPLQILAMPAPPEKADQVDVFIIYPSTATSKQYKIDDGQYQEYTGQLKITKNNTKITARTQYSDGSWSEEVSYTVTNVDENVLPEGIIEITAQPTEYTTENVTVTIKFNPNSEVLKKKYKQGTGKWQYTEENEVTFTVEENTTIYAAFENDAGQSSDAEVYNVENIDRSDPVIRSFKVTETTDTSLTVRVAANDPDTSIAKIEYKLGTGNYSVINEDTYTYKGLTAGDVYQLTVRVTDQIGNTAEKTINAVTGAVLVETKEDLKLMNDNPSETYMLVNDIDLAGENWTPVEDFRGNIYGCGNSIKNLTIQNDSAYDVGFIANTSSGVEIKDINFENINFNVKNQLNIGGVLGTTSSYNNVIENVKVTGTITYEPKKVVDTYKEMTRVGGIAGYMLSASITNCESDVIITENTKDNPESLSGNVLVSQILAETCVGSIKNCTSKGEINIVNDEKSSTVMSGILSNVADTSVNNLTISDCNSYTKFTADVAGSVYCGGIGCGLRSVRKWSESSKSNYSN